MGVLSLYDQLEDLEDEARFTWQLLHRIVGATRNTAEHNHPALFKAYDLHCAVYQERAVPARVLAEGRKGSKE